MSYKVLALGSTIVLLILAGMTTFAYGQQFSDWTAPVNLGPPVDTVGVEFQPAISRDGLSLYFTILEGDVVGAPQDIWVAQRNSLTDPWGTPQRLGPNVNSDFTEAHSFVTIDGHSLYFNSNRPGGFGRLDIYVAKRRNNQEDFPTDPSGGWMQAVNLGSAVNSSYVEQGPCLFEDTTTGVTTLYFNSNRPGGPGDMDIYASTLQPDGTFGPAVLVEELSTPYTDQHPQISRDGLTMFFSSNRPGSVPDPDTGEPTLDLWVSTRATTQDRWSEPENLGPPVNDVSEDLSPSLSFDGTTLYFHANWRVGNQSPNFDIWKTTRTKLEGKH